MEQIIRFVPEQKIGIDFKVASTTTCDKNSALPEILFISQLVRLYDCEVSIMGFLSLA
jgi:hypothetical protein